MPIKLQHGILSQLQLRMRGQGTVHYDRYALAEYQMIHRLLVLTFGNRQASPVCDYQKSIFIP